MNTVSNSREEAEDASKIPEEFKKIFIFAAIYGLFVAVTAFIGLGIVTGLIDTTSLFHKILWGVVLSFTAGALGFILLLAIYVASYNPARHS